MDRYSIFHLNIFFYFTYIFYLELDGEELNEDILIENKCFKELETEKSFEKETRTFIGDLYNLTDVAEALIIDFASLKEEKKHAIRQLQYDLNNSTIGWKRLDLVNDLRLLAALLYDWLEVLKYPVLDSDNLETIVVNYNQIEVCLSKFDMVIIYRLLCTAAACVFVFRNPHV